MTLTSDIHVPVRTCVGCGRRCPAHQLVRVALAGGVPTLERSAPGRGAWLCGPDCLPGARKRRGFQRAWRADLAPEVLDELESQLAATGGNDEMVR